MTAQRVNGSDTTKQSGAGKLNEAKACFTSCFKAVNSKQLLDPDILSTVNCLWCSSIVSVYTLIAAHRSFESFCLLALVVFRSQAFDRYVTNWPNITVKFYLIWKVLVLSGNSTA